MSAVGEVVDTQGSAVQSWTGEAGIFELFAAGPVWGTRSIGGIELKYDERRPRIFWHGHSGPPLFTWADELLSPGELLISGHSLRVGGDRAFWLITITDDGEYRFRVARPDGWRTPPTGLPEWNRPHGVAARPSDGSLANGSDGGLWYLVDRPGLGDDTTVGLRAVHRSADTGEVDAVSAPLADRDTTPRDPGGGYRSSPERGRERRPTGRTSSTSRRSCRARPAGPRRSQGSSATGASPGLDTRPTVFGLRCSTQTAT